MKHATVRIGEYTVPLIGVPKDATRDECSGCKRMFYIGDLIVDGDFKLLCKTCYETQRLPSKS